MTLQHGWQEINLVDKSFNQVDTYTMVNHMHTHKPKEKDNDIQ